VWAHAPMVECTMFYVLIFSLAAVLLVVAGVTTMSRRRRSQQAEEAHATSLDGHSTHAAHGTHPDATGRRNRKAKRTQSQHDRRKRH
jgi:Flp pilus assembly protein TadB